MENLNQGFKRIRGGIKFMKPGQKLVHDGHEVCLFPMEVMNITQWSSPTAESHCCGHPFDNAISGQVRVPVYAPFSCHL